MSNEVTTVDELRAIVGHPIEAVAKKVTDRLSGAHRLWLAHSPLGVVATTDAQGRATEVDVVLAERQVHIYVDFVSVRPRAVPLKAVC